MLTIRQFDVTKSQTDREFGQLHELVRLIVPSFSMWMANFAHAQQLKSTLDAATTLAEIDAVVW